MKKVSIFALLAIVIAVGSAFSTKEAKRFIDQRWALFIDGNVPVSTFVTSYNSGSNYHVTSDYGSLIDADLTEEQENDITEFCPGGTNLVCAVRVDIDLNTAGVFENADLPTTLTTSDSRIVFKEQQ